MADIEIRNLDELKANLPQASRRKPPPELRRQFEEEDLRREEAAMQRSRDASIRHALTGAMTFAILQLVLGFPVSILPLSLLENAVTSCLFGAPVGYWIGRVGGGVWRGAAISSFVFTGTRLVAMWLSGSTPSAFWLTVLLVAFAGALPGIIIGWHVEHAD